MRAVATIFFTTLILGGIGYFALWYLFSRLPF